MGAATYFLSVGPAGSLMGAGYTPDGTLPAGAVPCTQAQAEAWGRCTISNGVVTLGAPAPPTLAQQVAALLNAGCVIASTASPGVNGTYAVDPTSRATLAEIVAGINAGDGLPGGGASFIYDDACGAHTFAATGTVTAAMQVVAVGKGLRDFVYAAQQAIQNRTTVAPAQPWPIP